MPNTTSINFWNKDRNSFMSAKGSIALFYLDIITAPIVNKTKLQLVKHFLFIVKLRSGLTISDKPKSRKADFEKKFISPSLGGVWGALTLPNSV